MSGAYATLEDAVSAAPFPEADLALRRGRHVTRDDVELYAFLVDAEELLAAFYRRFGCDLVHKTDGYFYLLPTGDRLGRRHLSVAEMLVGQALALLYLDPAPVENVGVVSRDQVVAQLAGAMGADALVRAMNPKRRRVDERLGEQAARARVAEALRRLAALGFVDRIDDSHVRMRASLLRFAEPVRDAGEAGAALENLLARGELMLADDEDGEGASSDDGGFEDGEGASGDDGGHDAGALAEGRHPPTEGDQASDEDEGALPPEDTR